MTLTSRFSLICCAVFALFTLPATAQLTESFADGNFTQNPVWQGDTGDFIVNLTQQLQTSGAALAGVKTLATASRVSGAATWEFWANLKFGTSASNLADVFLVSDSARLTGRNTGYFVRLGGTPDEVSLFRKDGTGSTIIIDGTDGLLASTSNNLVRVRVTRAATGIWALSADPTGGTAFAAQGSARDTTYSNARYVGVVARYTASNSQKFYFDDFSITDTAPPAFRSLTVLSGNTLRIQFDEPIAPASGATAGNYTVGGVGAASSAVLDPLDEAAVLLTFSNPFASGLNTLTVGYAEDRYGNGTPTALTRGFRYTLPFQPGEVRITELFVDPSPAVGLPSGPFVEVLNTSGRTLNLAGWRLQDAAGAASGSAGTLRAGSLAPGQYALLTATADTTAYRNLLGPSARIIGITSMPTLNLTGDLVRLLAPLPATTTVDELTYTTAWYHDVAKAAGGWSLEKINPTKPCSDADNWIASNDPTGGTPGRLNSTNSTAPDVTAPSLVSATLHGSTTVELLFSEAIDTLTATLPRFTLTGGLSVTAIRFRPDSLRFVRITLNASLTPGTRYTLSIRQVADCSGNSSATPLTTTLLVGAVASLGEVRITELFVDTSIPAGNPLTTLPAAPFVEVLNTSPTKYFDLTGWKLQDATTSLGTLGTGILAPGQYAVLVRTTDTTAYRAFLGATVRVVGVTSMPTLNLTGDAVKLLTPDTLLIDHVTYADDWYRDPVKATGGWSLEKINPTKPCSDADNWIASNDPTGGTPGRLNSTNSTALDVTAPSLVSATLRGSTTVELLFSEAIDTLTASLPRFTLTGGLSVTAIQFRADSLKFVTLTLSAPLTPGIRYTLTISNVADCAGNTSLSPLTATLLVGAVASSGEVRITELFVDTSIPAGNPVTTLPAAPFVEVLNTSSTKYFDLRGWKLQDATTSLGTLGAGILAPGQYAVLVRTTDTTAYRTFLGATVRVVGVTSMPTLNLTGDAVKLLTPNTLLIDHVTYADDWYRDPVKAAGGWSLEKINPTKPCSDADNWIASNDPTGGTPGRVNSTNSTAPDVTAPTLVSATLRGSTTVELLFSEAIDTLTATLPRFTLTGGLSVTAIQFRADSLKFVTLTLSAPLTPGIRYTLTISNVADCAGNTSLSPLTATLLVGAVASSGEVRITELFVDTSIPAGNPLTTLPAAPFLEVLNTSTTKYFDLTGWKLQDATAGLGTLGTGILAPGQYAVLVRTTDTTAYRAFLGATVRVVGVTSMPTLNLTGDAVKLLTPDTLLIDHVTYADDWYRDPVKATGGWSLEKINPTKPCSDADNWIASNDPTGGTPGRLNSTNSTAPDVTAPTLVSATVVDATTVELVFSEALDTLTALPIRFALTGGLRIITTGIRSDSLRYLTLNLSGPLLAGTRYTLTGTGVADCAGNTAPFTTTFGLGAVPGPYELLLTEIYADETPSIGLPASEYVEIFNPTNRLLDLTGVTLRKQGASSAAVFPAGASLAPGHYAVVCGSTRGGLFAPFGQVFALTNFPSLNNAGDTLVLRRPGGELLFSVAYSDQWYRDPTKTTGGWSLEMIDFTQPCGLADNWKASENLIFGGSPGTVNSVSGGLPALPAPTLVAAAAEGLGGVRMLLTQKVDSLTASNPAHYTLSGGLSVGRATVLGPEMRVIVLTLSGALVPGQTVVLTANGLTGCSGANAPLTASVLVPEQPRLGDVVINEILFNPRPGGADFVELVNRSDRQLDLNGYYLGNMRGDSLYQIRRLAPNGFPLPPGSLAALTSAPDSVVRQYPASSDRSRMLLVPSMPTFSDDKGTVVLLAPDSTELARYAYDARQHTPLLIDEEGVSLERIRLDGPDDATNFHSAASTVGFATPGKANSQTRAPLDPSDHTLSIEPRVITPGQGGAEFADIIYAVPSAGYTANFTIFDSQGRLTRRLARNQTLSVKGSFQWQGEDDNNRRVPTGYYVLYAEFFDLQGTVKVIKQTVAVGNR